MRALSKNSVALSLVATAVSLGGAQAHADGVVRSDFAFQMNNTYFAAPEYEIAPKLVGQERIEMPDMTIQDEAPVQVTGIEAAFVYKMRSASKYVFLGAEQAIVSEEVSARVAVKRVSLDAVIERVVGGVVVRARVQAECNDIVLDLPKGEATLMGSLRTGVDEQGLPTISVPWFDVTWRRESWKATIGSCTGASGFGPRVVEKIKDYLKDTEKFKKDMRVKLDAKLAQQQIDMRKSFLKPKAVTVDIPGVSATLRPMWISEIKGGRFQVRGEIDFLFKHDTVVDVKVVKGAQVSMTETGFVLGVPDQLPPALVDMGWRTGKAIVKKKASEVPPFRNVQASPFKMGFVWPEINNYTTDTEFLFAFSTGKLPGLSVPEAAVGGLAGTFDTELTVGVSAPIGAAYEKMSDFRTPVHGTYSAVIAGSELKLSLTSAPEYTLSHQWDGTYYVSRLRNPDVDVKRIQDEISKSPTSIGTAVQLGKFPINGVRNLVPSALRKMGHSVLIDWK